MTTTMTQAPPVGVAVLMPPIGVVELITPVGMVSSWRFSLANDSTSRTIISAGQMLSIQKAVPENEPKDPPRCGHFEWL